MTLREAISEARARLCTRQELAEQAPRDADLLVMHVLQVPRTALLAHPDRPLSEREQAQLQQALERRVGFEPMQYITGQQEFFGLNLRVSPDVLIPRPETEVLVEAVLERLPRSSPVTIADVGTGSGAIAVVLASQLPLARVIAIDLSEAALEVAKENAATHGVADRVQFVSADLLTGLDREPSAAAPASDSRRARRLSGALSTSVPLDAVVSNPPYVSELDRGLLHPQVRAFEPAGALFAGEDGLDIYRRLIPQAAAALVPGGLLALEIGAGQDESVGKLLAGWRSLEFVDDLRQIPRVVLARRP